MAKLNFSGYQADLADFCQHWKVAELALFDPVQHDDSRPDYDVGVLVTLPAGGRLSQFDLINMQNELERILSRKVNLVERKALEQSTNSSQRKLILSEIEVVYTA
jgi:uncharacterized protein